MKESCSRHICFASVLTAKHFVFLSNQKIFCTTEM